eukprot:2315529-Amphidinium_carterae.2
MINSWHFEVSFSTGAFQSRTLDWSGGSTTGCIRYMFHFVACIQRKDLAARNDVEDMEVPSESTCVFSQP